MKPPTPRTVVFDWDEFHRHVEAKRVEHDARPDERAVAVSLAAFQRWGVRPPREFLQQHPEAAAVVRRGYR